MLGPPQKEATCFGATMPHRPKPNDPAILKLVAEGARVGLTFELIAKHSGIHIATLYKWAKQGREGSELHQPFAAALDNNESRGAVACMARIHKAAAGGTWQAAAWIMERRHGFTVQRANMPDLSDEDGGAVDPWHVIDMAIAAAPHEIEARLAAARAKKAAG